MADEAAVGTNDFLIAVQLQDVANFTVLLDAMKAVQEQAKQGAKFRVELDPESLAAMNREIADKVKARVDVNVEGGSGGSAADAANFRTLRESIDALKGSVDGQILNELKAHTAALRSGGGKKGEGKTYTAPNGATVRDFRPDDAPSINYTELNDRFITIADNFARKMNDAFLQIPKLLDLSELAAEAERYRRAAQFGVRRPVADYKEALQRYRDPRTPENERQYLQSFVYDALSQSGKSEASVQKAQERSARRRERFAGVFGDEDVAVGASRRVLAQTGFTGFREGDVLTKKTGLDTGELRATQVAIVKKLRQEAARLDAEVATAVRELDASRRTEIADLRQKADENEAHARAHDNNLTPVERHGFIAKANLQRRTADTIEAETTDVNNEKNRELQESGARKKKLAQEKRNAADSLQREFEAYATEFAAILPTNVVAQARTRIRKVSTDLEAAIRELKANPQAFSRATLEEHFRPALENPLIETAFGAGQQDPRVMQQIRATDIRLKEAKADRDDLLALRDKVSPEGVAQREKDLAAVRSRIRAASENETYGGPDPADVQRLEKVKELREQNRKELEAHDKNLKKLQQERAALVPPGEDATQADVEKYNEARVKVEGRLQPLSDATPKITFRAQRLKEEQEALEKRIAEAPPVTTGRTPEREAVIVRLRAEEERLEKGLKALKAAIPAPDIVRESVERVEALERQLHGLESTLKQGFNLDPSDISGLERLKQRLDTVRQALEPAVAFAAEFKPDKGPTPPKFNPFDVYTLERDKAGNVAGVKVDQQMNKELLNFIKQGGQFQSFGPEQQNILVNALAAKEGAVRNLRRENGSSDAIAQVEREITQLTGLMRVGGEYFYAGHTGERPFERFQSLEPYLQYNQPNAVSEQDLDAALDRMRKLGVRSGEPGSAAPLGVGGTHTAPANVADLTRLAALLGPGGGDGIKGLLQAFQGVDLSKQTRETVEFVQALTGLAHSFDRLTPATRRVVLAQAKREDQAAGLALTKDNRADKTKNERELIQTRKFEDRVTKIAVEGERGTQQQETARVRAQEQRDTDQQRYEQKTRLQAAAARVRQLLGGVNARTIAQSLFGFGITTPQGGVPDRDEPGIIKGLNDQLRKVASGQESFAQNQARVQVLGDNVDTTREQARMAEAEKAVGAATSRFIDFGRQAGRNPRLHELFTNFDAYNVRGELRNRAGEQLPAGEPLLGPSGLVERLDQVRTRRASLRNDYERVNKISLDLQNPDVIADPDRRRELRGELADTRRRLERQGFTTERDATGRVAIDPATGERVTGTKKLENALVTLKLAEDAVAAAAQKTAKTYLELSRPTEEATTRVERFAGKVKQLATYMGAGFLLYGAVSQIHKFTSEVIDLESELARIQGVLESRSLGDRLRIEQGVIESAEKYGQKIKDVAAIAKTFAQTGLTPKETVRETQAALLGVQGAGLEPAQTVETLVATRNISGGQVTPENILDRISHVEARNAVTAQDLSVALQRVGSLATQLQPKQVGGLDAFDTVIGAVTQIVEETRVTGSAAATSLKFILSRLTSPEVANNLQKKFGIALAANEQGTELRPLIDILEDIARKFKELSDPNQKGGPRSIEAAQLLQTVAGNRQVNAASALFGDFDKVLKTAEESAFAFGDTQARLAIQQDTLRFKLDRLSATALDLANAFLVNTGALGFLKGTVDALAGTFKFLSGRDFAAPGEEPNKFVAGILPPITAAISSLGLLKLGTLAARTSGAVVQAKGVGTFAAELGGILKLFSAFNPILRIAVGLFTALALSGGLKALVGVVNDFVGRREPQFKPIDAQAVRESALGKQFTERASNLGQTPQSLVESTVKAIGRAAGEVQEEHKGLNLFTLDRDKRQFKAGVADDLQQRFVKYLADAVPALGDMTDKAEQTAEAMRILKESTQFSSVALGQRRSELTTKLGDLQSNLADRLEEFGQRDVPRSLTDYFRPRLGTKSVGDTFSYNSVVAESRGSKSVESVTRDIDKIIDKAFGPELSGVAKNLTIITNGRAAKFDVEVARLIDTARQQGDASVTLGRAMDTLATQYLTLSREQEGLVDKAREAVRATLPANATEQQTRAAIAANLRTRGVEGGVTADVFQTTNLAKDRVTQRLAANYQLEANIADTKHVGGELTQFGAAGGGAISKAMLQIVIDASKDLVKQLESRGQTGESKALREALAALEASDNRDKFLANVAKSVKQRPGRDEVLAVISRFAQQREEINTAERLFRGAGIGVDAQQERAAASQQAIRGLGGVRAKLEGELFQLFQKRGELSEVGKSLSTVLGQPTEQDDENARQAAGVQVRSALSRTAGGIDPAEIEKLDRSISFVTDALGDIEKNKPLFDQFPDDLRKRIDNALKNGDLVARIETFRDAERALVGIAAAAEKVLRVRERHFDVLQAGQQLEGERADRAVELKNLREESQIASLEAVGGPQAALRARRERVADTDDAVERARREATNTKRTLTEQKNAGLIGDVDFQTKSLLADLKSINAQEVATLEARNKEVELLENARNELLRDTVVSQENLARQAFSGLRDLFAGGYSGFRGDREGRKGPVGRDVARRVVEPFAGAISGRIADNFLETLVGHNGVLNLSKLFGNNLLTEQQLLQQHRALELVSIKQGAYEGVLQGLQAERAQVEQKLASPSLDAARQLKGVAVPEPEQRRADFTGVVAGKSTTAPLVPNAIKTIPEFGRGVDTLPQIKVEGPRETLSEKVIHLFGKKVFAPSAPVEDATDRKLREITNTYNLQRQVGVAPSTLRGHEDALAALQRELKAAGIQATVTSGTRTFEEQKSLFERYSKGLSKYPAARPGTSKHEVGDALDVYVDPQFQGRLTEIMSRLGYANNVPNDRVHFTRVPTVRPDSVPAKPPSEIERSMREFDARKARADAAAKAAAAEAAARAPKPVSPSIDDALKAIKDAYDAERNKTVDPASLFGGKVATPIPDFRQFPKPLEIEPREARRQKLLRDWREALGGKQQPSKAVLRRVEQILDQQEAEGAEATKYPSAQAKRNAVTTSPFADSLYALGKRPVIEGGDLGKSRRGFGIPVAEYIPGENKVRFDDFAAKNFPLSDSASTRQQRGSSRADLEWFLSHEMGHQQGIDVDKRLFYTMHHYTGGADSNDNYSNTDFSERFAQAYANAIDFLRSTDKGKVSDEQLRDSLTHRERDVAGTGLMTQLLLDNKSLYEHHPLKNRLPKGPALLSEAEYDRYEAKIPHPRFSEHYEVRPPSGKPIPQEPPTTVLGQVRRVFGLDAHTAQRDVVPLTGGLPVLERARVRTAGANGLRFVGSDLGIGRGLDLPPVPKVTIPSIPDVVFPSAYRVPTASALLGAQAAAPTVLRFGQFDVDKGKGVNGTDILRGPSVDGEAVKRLQDQQDQKLLDAQLRQQARQQFKSLAAAMGGQLLGGYFGGTKAGVNHGYNYGSEGATLGSAFIPQLAKSAGGFIGGTAGTLLGGPVGSLIGGLVGGLIGGLFKKKQEKPVEYAQAERIERNTRETVSALDNQSHNLFSLDQRLFNVPASFTLPQYRPITSGAGLGGAAGDTYYKIDVHVPVQNNADHAAIADSVSASLKRELGLTGRNVSEKY